MSDIASDISSGFKIPADEMGRVADVLTATFTGSNTTIEGLGETMKYLGPVAQATGQGFKEMAAMVGLLGNVGIKGSQAGTSLRAAMLRLAGPPKQAREALEDLNVSTKDSRGNMRTMTDILLDVHKKTKHLGSVDQMAYFKKIFCVEAATAMIELVNQAGEEGIQAMTDNLKKANGKYDPAGIVHKGEYVLTKETTARLGIANLNRLNYGGMAELAAFAGSVALAQPAMPVKVDNRPPLANRQTVQTAPISQNVNITINATSGQNPQEIAKLVAMELQKQQRLAQAKSRSSLRDRA